MISLDLTNGITEEELYSEASKLEVFLELIHKREQGFYKVIDDNEVVEKINKFAESAKGKFDHVVVCGIGGSALGAKCLQQSLTHSFKNQSPSLHVLDNIDPVLIKELEDVIDYPKTLFIVITKSGETIETASQHDYFSRKLKEKNLDLSRHLITITGQQENPTQFDIPQNVGGRFSVLTAVGLLPAKLIGINIEKLLEGAKKMRDSFLSTKMEENLPFQLAATQFLLSQKGKTINVIMPYSQKLTKFADWTAQLIAESTGKDGKGITPIKALGVTDQHSQLQLYADGPNDKLIIFIEIKDPGPKIEIKKPYKTDFGTLMNIEKTATAEALTKKSRPNITILVNSLTEESLGQLFLLFEGATAFLGEFFQINAFDQPGVELSKKLTKEALLK